jgi:shikimate dehydrogenase
MDRYAVIGNPVAHSRSPEIHAMFAAQTGELLRYDRIEARAENFETRVSDFFAGGGKGLNVTLPFKQRAHDLAIVLDDAAREAGAVNILMPRDHELWGGNTDGIGLVRDLTVNHGIVLQGARILMLGAGGAVRGVLGALLASGAQEIVIVNRTHDRGEALAAHWSDPRVRAERAEDCRESFPLVINGTAASLRGQVPAIGAQVLDAECFCYDMVYANEDTAFVAWAKSRGARAADGLGMLVEQAAESFFIWRGVRPLTTPVMDALRASS